MEVVLNGRIGLLAKKSDDRIFNLEVTTILTGDVNSKKI